MEEGARRRRGGVLEPDSAAARERAREGDERGGPAWLGWALAQSGAGSFFLYNSAETKKILENKIKIEKRQNKFPPSK